MMEDHLINLLTASSILLAIITALWGIFFSSIIAALEFEPSRFPVDDKSKYKYVRDTTNSKLLPLLVGSVIISSVFAVEFVNQIGNSIVAIFKVGLLNTSYDTISAAYIVVCLFIFSITISIIITGIKLRQKKNKLKV